MLYYFDISYPTDDPQLQKIQDSILKDYPTCQGPHCQRTLDDKYHNKVYTTGSAQDIARIASSLKNADSRFFVGFVGRDGKDIYYNPIELPYLPPEEKQQYIQLLSHLPQTERVLHDYLVNLYKNVPLR